MRRLAVLIASAAAFLGAASPAFAGRSDDASKPVVFLSGGDSSTANCNDSWVRIQLRLMGMEIESGGQTFKFKGDTFKTVTNYKSDKECDAVAGDGESKGIDGQAKDFATWLSTTYKGRPVDVVAHGTGGIVLRYALAMSQAKTAGWPALAVEDAITVGTPHAGSTALAHACPNRIACSELDPTIGTGQAMLAKLATFPNPQGVGGTDWTVIGATKDELVAPESALGMDAAHETTFKGDKLTHAGMLNDISEDRDATVTYQHRGQPVIEWRKSPHIAVRVGLNLVFGSDGNLSAPTNSPQGCTGSTDVTGGPVIVRFPGLQSWPGTADLSYVKSGILEAYSACFTEDKKTTGLLVSSTTVRLNGLDIVPAKGTTITIDPAKRHVVAEKMSISIPSRFFGGIAVPLYSDRALDWYLPKEAGALQGNDLDGWKLSGDAKLFGRRFKGSLKLSVTQGATNLEGSIALPGSFQGKVPAGGQPECGDGVDNDDDGRTDVGPTGDDNCEEATDNYEDAADNPGFAIGVRTDNQLGLQLDKVSGTFEGNLKLGGFSLPSASLAYTSADSMLTGTVSATTPLFNGAKLTAGLGISFAGEKWQFAKFDGEADGLNKLLPWGGLFLQKVKVGIVRDPWSVLFGARVSVGPRAPIFGKSSAAATEFEGEVTVSGTGVKIGGKVYLLGDEWGSANIDINGSGVTLAGELGRDLELRKASGVNKLRIKSSIKANVQGVADKTGLDIKGGVKACFEGELKLTFYTREQENTCLAQAELRVSAKKGNGLALTVCGQADFGPWAGSFGWGGKATTDGNGYPILSADVIAGSCDVDSWHTPASASQAGGRSVQVAAGLPAAVFGVEGSGGVPHIGLRGPGGKVIAAPASASGIVKGDGWIMIHSPADQSTYVIVAKPAAGEWTVEPAADSAPVAEVKSADALPAPEVKATVKGAAGAKQRVTYDVKQIEGQTVSFREIGGGAVATVGTARGAQGSFTFKPSFGKGGARRIVAVVEQRGLPRAELNVASYRAAAPRKLAAPRGVKLLRRGERLDVSWKKVPGAVSYVVDVATGDGRAIHFEPTARRIVVKRMFDSRASRVTLRAVRVDGKPGRAKTVRGGRQR